MAPSPRRFRAIIGLTVVAAAAAMGAGTSASQPATPSRPGASQPGRSGEIGIRLLQVPVSERNDPRARLYIIDHVAPGQVIHRKFQVANVGGAAAAVQLYAASASIKGGSFSFSSGRTQNDMTTWVRISPPAVNLAAGKRATLTATIAVPGDAPPGEQYGVIWAQVGGTGSGNIKLVTRVGIRIYLSVGPGNAPAANFTIGQPVASRTADGRPMLRVAVHNTGGRALDVRGSLQLTGGPAGLQAGPFPEAAIITLAPGQSYHLTFAMSPQLPNGPWQALITLQSGLVIRTERATVNFRAGVSAAAGFPTLPVAGGVAVAFLVAAAGIIVVRSRRSVLRRS